MGDLLGDLEQEIEEMDPCPERDELQEVYEFGRDLQYLLDEGFIEAERSEDGEIRFYPCS